MSYGGQEEANRLRRIHTPEPKGRETDETVDVADGVQRVRDAVADGGEGPTASSPDVLP